MSEQDEIFERATETPIALAPSKGGKGALRADVAVAKCPKVTVMTYVLGADGPTPRKLSAAIYHESSWAELYDGDDKVAAINFMPKVNKTRQYTIVRRAFCGLISACGHNRRGRQNAKTRRWWRNEE